MSYFIVFNKKGIVEFEKGETPIFLNSLIRSINIQQSTGSKNIRDLLMEYQVEGSNLYLSLNNKPTLTSLIEKYKTPQENSTITTDNSLKTSTQNSLDFSSSKSKLSTVIESIKHTDLKRAFSLFTNKISVHQLRSTMIEHLVKKNVDPSFCQTITDDVISDLKSENIDMVTQSLFKEKVTQALTKIIPKFDHEKFLDAIRNNNGVFFSVLLGSMELVKALR